MSSEDEDSASASGKWAVEAFGFLRFYQRVGNQLWGLILLEIGWAALMLLVGKLLPDEGPRTIHELAIVDIFLVGALVVGFCWCFSSGLYLYVRLLLGRVLRWIAIPLLWLAVGILVLVQFLFEHPQHLRIQQRLKNDAGRDRKIFALLEAEKKKADAPWSLKIARWFDPPSQALFRGLQRLKSVGRIGRHTRVDRSPREAAASPLWLRCDTVG